MRKLEVGVVFWQFEQIIDKDHRLHVDYLRHEVRGIVDDQFVHRRWSTKHGGIWRYWIEPNFAWQQMQEIGRTILFDEADVREARKALKEPT